MCNGLLSSYSIHVVFLILEYRSSCNNHCHAYIMSNQYHQVCRNVGVGSNHCHLFSLHLSMLSSLLKGHQDIGPSSHQSDFLSNLIIMKLWDPSSQTPFQINDHQVISVEPPLRKHLSKLMIIKLYVWGPSSQTPILVNDYQFICVGPYFANLYPS